MIDLTDPKFIMIDLTDPKFIRCLKIVVGNAILDDPDYVQKIQDIKIHEGKRAIKFLGLKETSVILDFGSGLGWVSGYVSDFVDRIYCYDVDSTMLTYCKNYLKDKTNITYLGPSLTDLSDIKVNRIMANSVFWESFDIHDIHKPLQLFYDILDDGGRVMFDYYNLDFKSSNWDVGDDKNWYAPQQINDIASHIGFKILAIQDTCSHAMVLLKK